MSETEWALNVASGKYTGIADCWRCGTACAWAKSKRTGKSYLCEIERSESKTLALPYKPHKCGGWG